MLPFGVHTNPAGTRAWRKPQRLCSCPVSVLSLGLHAAQSDSGAGPTLGRSLPRTRWPELYFKKRSLRTQLCLFHLCEEKME